MVLMMMTLAMSVTTTERALRILITIIIVIILIIVVIIIIAFVIIVQTLAVTVERYIAVCRPHQHLGLVTVTLITIIVTGLTTWRLIHGCGPL